VISVDAVVRRTIGKTSGYGGLMVVALGAATAALSLAGCGASADRWFCASQGCDWTKEEWARIESLSPLPDPPGDLSNDFWNVSDAAELGQAFYFDTRFSGNATLVDSIGNTVPYARASPARPATIRSAGARTSPPRPTPSPSAPAGTTSTGKRP